MQTGEVLLQVLEHGLHLVHSDGVLAEAGLADDRHARVGRDSLQLRGEGTQVVLLDVLLLGEAGDGPDLHVDAGVELLAAHVPHALVGQRRHLGPASVEQLGGVQDSSLHLRHHRLDDDSELLGERVLAELRTAHEVRDLALAFRSRSGGRLDHGGGLDVGQLLDAPLTGHDLTHFGGEVRVLLLLPHLQTREVGVLERHIVLVLEILGNRGLDGLPVLQLEGECLGGGRTPCDVADSVLSSHAAAVRDLDLQSTNLLGELDPLSITECSAIAQSLHRELQHLGDEVDHRHLPVERRSGHVDVQHHLPLARADGLVETEPHLTTPSEFAVPAVVLSLARSGGQGGLGGREEGSANRGVSHAGEVTQNDVHRLHGVGRDIADSPNHRFVQSSHGN